MTATPLRGNTKKLQMDGKQFGFENPLGLSGVKNVVPALKKCFDSLAFGYLSGQPEIRHTAIAVLSNLHSVVMGSDGKVTFVRAFKDEPDGSRIRESILIVIDNLDPAGLAPGSIYLSLLPNSQFPF